MKNILLIFSLVLVLFGLVACGGGGGSGSNVGAPSVSSDCVLDQSVIGSCTLG